MSLSKIGHIILIVRDLDRSLAFYHDLLGMTVKYTIPGEFVFLDGGGVTLALSQSGEPQTVVPGAVEVSFETEDVLSTYETLKSRGGSSSASLLVL
jgi:catechol 2,3-dioxygenase-like lactoylglutathione lyase family enzyme